jgi:mevalonate kinase
MTAIAAYAPGKIILFGEHAVVYGRPAIAVPVSQVRARASVTANPLGRPGQVRIVAGDIGLESDLGDLPSDHPLALAIAGVTRMLKIEQLPALRLQITSTIPIAAGLGSGAAVSVAITRGLSAFLGHPLADEEVSHIAYQVDQKYHGTPSGIDNTVIAYEQPIFFIRGQPFIHLCTAQPFTVVIGNTGISSSTAEVVGDVRRRWQAGPQPYERVFDEIGAIARQARQIMEEGAVEQLGPLMTRNHALLQQLDVSSPELDRLVAAAQAAGAGGAKLCGGGRGGNMIALAKPETAQTIAGALRNAGAVNTIITKVSNTEHGAT